MYPKLISIGSFSLPTYGVLIAIAFVVALWITVRLGTRAGLDKEKLMNLGIYCALVGLLGAKILMILFDLNYFIVHPSELISLSTLQAAGVFQGGLVLAVLFAWLYTRKFKMPWLTTADVFAPGIAIGHAIGRLGCLAAGCCWGVVCDRPWAITFRNNQATTGVPLYQPLHPTQLYEFACEALTFGFLYWRIGRPRRPGSIIGLYLVISSVLRFVVEFYRYHDQPLPFGLPLSITQWISLGLIALGAALLWKSKPALDAKQAVSRA
jgi:phosphatidylglycerol---prolipoprotein diacylglyceryl transferase